MLSILVLLMLLQSSLPLSDHSAYEVITYEFVDKTNTTCVIIEIPKNSSFYITKPDENISIAFDDPTKGSGKCDLRNGTFVNMPLQNGYNLQWHWLFDPEPFMEMFGQGFNTVGAEEYLLHGTYALANLTVTNMATKEILRANTTSYSGLLNRYFLTG
ncbi:unnamed protein product [Rodentolepis nana]|uniref:CUB domain-containing protein n=1 Tax=Rodentolepis nana TaxID=102285 RepID=A0A0R3T7G4_RODNA|nr:unnamed protein product [Rodentolepis nana]